MPHSKYNQKIERLKTVLEKIADQASRTSGFVQRESKLGGAGFVQTLVLGCLEAPEVSLNRLVQVSADLHIDISPSGLNQRIDWEAVELLREVLAESLQHWQADRGAPRAVLEQFKGVYLLDSTQVSLPDSLRDVFQGNGGEGNTASLKLHLCYEYLHGTLAALDMTDGRAPDQKCRLHVDLAPPGSLHLFDLGFFKQEHLAELHEADAYFLSRYQSQTALYWQPDDAAGFDVAAFTRSIRGDRCELNAYLGRKSRVPVRVVFQRLPPCVVQERRRKARAKLLREKKTPSQQYLTLLEWAILITNLPPTALTLEQLLLVYRVRWQIELIFKVWKSQAHLETFGSWRPARILCQLFARLTGLVLFHWLIAPYRWREATELSLDKAFQVLQRHLPTIAQTLALDWSLLVPVLARLEHDFLRFACKDSRKKSPSTFRALCLAGA